MEILLRPSLTVNIVVKKIFVLFYSNGKVEYKLTPPAHFVAQKDSLLLRL